MVKLPLKKAYIGQPPKEKFSMHLSVESAVKIILVLVTAAVLVIFANVYANDTKDQTQAKSTELWSEIGSNPTGN